MKPHPANEMLHCCCRSNISSTTLQGPLTCMRGPQVGEERGRRAIGSARHVIQGDTPTGAERSVLFGCIHHAHFAEMSVPVVDFSACGLQRADVDRGDLSAAAKELHAAFTQVGLVFLQNSGISPEEVRRGVVSRRTRVPRRGHGSGSVCVSVCRSAGLWSPARGSLNCLWRKRRPSNGAASPTTTMAGWHMRVRGWSKLMLLLFYFCVTTRRCPKYLCTSFLSLFVFFCFSFIIFLIYFFLFTLTVQVHRVNSGQAGQTCTQHNTDTVCFRLNPDRPEDLKEAFNVSSLDPDIVRQSHMHQQLITSLITAAFLEICRFRRTCGEAVRGSEFSCLLIGWLCPNQTGLKWFPRICSHPPSLHQRWPSVPLCDFQEIQTSFFLRCKELSLRILRVMALSLDLDPEVFLSTHQFIASMWP